MHEETEAHVIEMFTNFLSLTAKFIITTNGYVSVMDMCKKTAKERNKEPMKRRDFRET
jgi:hypothetical protein